jgi:hypothetical protein
MEDKLSTISDQKTIPMPVDDTMSRPTLTTNAPARTLQVYWQQMGTDFVAERIESLQKIECTDQIKKACFFGHEEDGSKKNV